MSKQTIKRALALTIACMLMMAFLVEAVAETVYVLSSAPVYNSSGKKLGTIGAGTKLNLVAQKSGWAIVESNGSKAYMKTSTLTKLEELDNVTAYTKASAPIYKISSGKTKKLGTIAAGKTLTVSAKLGSWAYVSYGKYKGFVKASKLTTTAPAKNESSSKATSITVYTNKNGAKVYNKSRKVIGTLDMNYEMKLTAVDGNVCRVARDGNTAYMHKSDLSTEKTTVTATATPTPTATKAPESKTITAYVKKDGAKFYTSAGKVAGTLSVNTELTVTAVKGSVCSVTKDGNAALMKKSDLSTTKVEVKETPAQSITAYVKNDDAKFYNTSGKAVGTLDVNTALTVTAVKGNVCRVTKDSSTAYMKKSDLSTNKVDIKEENGVVEVPATTCYVKNDGAKVYTSSGSVMTTLSINTAVKMDAYNDTLCRVVNGSITGYMLKTDLSTSKVDVPETNYTLKYGDTGEAVKRIQSRLKELGYFKGNIGGNYLTLTQSAVAAFQSVAKISTDGVADYATLKALFADDAPKKPASSSGGSGGSGNSTATPAKGKAIQMDWWTSGIQSIFSRGSTAVITDVTTGLSWREQRHGGTNHADVQPVTSADTATLKKVYGGSWSWSRRAIFVTIDGVNYAASMNGMPHGGGSNTKNNFNGHHCIHFSNSRTHGSNKVCNLHQAAIKKALAATL